MTNAPTKDWAERLLEDVADRGAIMGYTNLHELLRAKLLPLLLAGQAMREHEMEHPSGFTRWDAAVKVASESR